MADSNSYFRKRAGNSYLTGAPLFNDDRDQTVFIRRDGPFGVRQAPPPIPPLVQMAKVSEAPPAPSVTSPSPLDVIEQARGAYEAKVPTTAKGRILEALKTAGLGFLQGAARDPNNPLAAGLGGAAAGGAISAVSPRTGRAFQFETIVRPRLEDRQRREEARARAISPGNQSQGQILEESQPRFGAARIPRPWEDPSEPAWKRILQPANKPPFDPLRLGFANRNPGAKAIVDVDFVNYVAKSLGITPEEAKRRIEADDYKVR